MNAVQLVSACTSTVGSGFLNVLPSECDVLRPHQRRQLEQLAQALRGGCRRPLVQAPTGSGKTHIIAAVTVAASVASLRVLILATRTRLVRQISERLIAFNQPHGVIAASLPGMTHAAMSVQVASADTLYRRCIADQRRPLPAADVVILDEGHLATAESRLRILQRYPAALHIGFTATPARKSGRSLSAAFDCLIQGPSVLELIHAGLLVRPRIFNTPIVSTAELKALPKDAASDYAAGALGDLLRRPKLVGDVVQNWLRIAAAKRTLVFAVNKAHGASLVEEFCRAGVTAELLTDQDAEDAREAALERLESDQTRVLVNCFLLAYGIDLPTVECIVLARPTRSLVMYLQMVGRGLRPAEGKEHCVLVDHGRCVESLGLPTADFRWTLDDRRNVNSEALEGQRRRPTLEQPRICAECGHVWLVSEDGPSCGHCGWTPAPRAKPITVEHADLTELAEDAAPVSPYAPEVAAFFSQAMGWYTNRWPDRWREREKSGRWWSWVKTRERFKIAETIKPPGQFWSAAPSAAAPDVGGWLHSRHIRDMKSRRWAA